MSSHAGTELVFILNQTFNTFMQKWPSRIDKNMMLETWANTIRDIRIQMEHIQLATDYCISTLDTWPTVYQFKIYCERAANGAELDLPIVTKSEEIAHRILHKIMDEDESFADHLQEYTEAFLIAALAAHRAAYLKAEMPYAALATEEVSWRFGMFVKELSHWVKLSDRDSDFWLATFFRRLALLA